MPTKLIKYNNWIVYLFIFYPADKNSKLVLWSADLLGAWCDEKEKILICIPWWSTNNFVFQPFLLFAPLEQRRSFLGNMWFVVWIADPLCY